MLLAALVGSSWGADVQLGALGGYRGTFDRVGAQAFEEHFFEQSLRAQIDAALVDRALAAWHVGFALDHTLTLGPDRTRVLGYQYDAAVQLWEDGDLPLRLFAARQTTTAERSLIPGFQVSSDTYGYEAGIRPPGLPRIESLGVFQRRRTANLGQIVDERSSVISGHLMHNDNRLLAIAGIEQRRNEDRVADDRRDISEADAFVEYRLDQANSLVARARARRYASNVADASFLLDTFTSDARFTTRPNRRLIGNTFYRITEQAGPDHRSGNGSVGTAWTWYPTETLSGVAQAGIGNTWLGDDGFLGQYANVSANYATWQPTGGYQLFAQTGVASVMDDSDGGVQGGAGGGGVVRRVVGPLQAAVGADVGRQLDSSDRAQSFVRYGWLAEVSTQRVAGLQLQLQLTQGVIDQRLVEEGDSDRFLATGLVAFRPEGRLDVVYGLNVYRDVLDEVASSGTSHAVTARIVASERLQLLGLYQYAVANATDLDALWSHRVDSTVQCRLPFATASGRLSHLLSGGRVTPARNTIVWVELARDFQWRF